MKATLQTTSGAEITTYQQLVSNLSYVEGSESRGSYTRTGQFMLNEKPVTVYRHWSHDGNYGIYTGENCENLIAEIVTGEWFDYVDENGNQIKDEHGIYDLVDAEITINLISYKVPLEMELTRVYHQKDGGRVCDFLTNVSLEEVMERNEWLRDPDRKIIKTVKQKITINNSSNCNDTFRNGILRAEYLDEKPDLHSEKRAWNEFYQKTTGNPLPKGGIF